MSSARILWLQELPCPLDFTQVAAADNSISCLEDNNTSEDGFGKLISVQEYPASASGAPNSGFCPAWRCQWYCQIRFAGACPRRHNYYIGNVVSCTEG